MEIISVNKIQSKGRKRMLALEIVDLKELFKKPDNELKITLALLYNPKLNNKQLSEITGKTIKEIEEINGKDKSLFLKEKPEIVCDEKPFNAREIIEVLINDKENWKKILAMYWIIKELKINDKTGYRMLFSPLNIKMAKQLSVFDLKTIKKAMLETKRFAEQKQFNWDLKTVLSFANKVANT